MREWVQFIALVALVAGAVAAWFVFARRAPRPKLLPPPRSRSTEVTHRESDAVARLFIITLSLKEEQARWPQILKALNPENEPRIRTHLLELRSLRTGEPGEILQALEETCIELKPVSAGLTRADVLEHVYARLRKS